MLFLRRGMHPAIDPSAKGENFVSPLWKPQWFCARSKLRGILIISECGLILVLSKYPHIPSRWKTNIQQ